MSVLLHKSVLPFVVFCTGACVLIIEIVAIRILAPYFGNTIYTVSSVLTVVLAALSFGYALGGKMADTAPSVKTFFWLIAGSGMVVLLLGPFGARILPFASEQFSMATGPLIASLILFAGPSLLLGLLSPYAVKLQSLLSPDRGIGSVSGNIFFWSTLGSITGSLLTGFYLIPHHGLDWIMLATGLFLFVLGIVPLLWMKDRVRPLMLALVVALATGAGVFDPHRPVSPALIHAEDGLYEKIQIVEGVFRDRPVRYFLQDSGASSAMYLDTRDQTDLVFDYTRYAGLYRFTQPTIERALVLGGAAYSVPKMLLAEQPRVQVDVIDIEPSVYPLARRYFDVRESPRLRSITEDGRRHLQSTDTRYDLMFVDVFTSLSVPAHFTTQEFFTLAKERLSERGVLVMNVIGDLMPGTDSLAFSLIKTFRTSFPDALVVAVDSPRSQSNQNIMLVGYRDRAVLAEALEALRVTEHSFFRSVPEKIITAEEKGLVRYPILSDNYAPVEYLSAKMLERAFDRDK